MKTRYTRTRTGTMRFLKPYESFCKIDGDDGYLDSDTSCRRYVFVRKNGNRRMKFLVLGRNIPTRLILLIRGGWKRKNFLSTHYDDNRIYSNRKFWFFRTEMKDMY